MRKQYEYPDSQAFLLIRYPKRTTFPTGVYHWDFCLYIFIGILHVDFNKASKVDHRMLRYLYFPDNPLIWWKQNANEYPNIKKLAVLYFTPSSVNSERLISMAGSIYTENQNILSR